MHWNHRVIEEKLSYESDGEIVTETYLYLAEVYYNDKTSLPYAHCEPHMCGDNIEELQQTVERFQEALKQPILTEANFTGTYDGEEEDE